MKNLFITISVGFTSLLSFSQTIDKTINVKEVERIEKILSADDMGGRKPFTPGIEKAADFIAAEFEKSNLSYYNNNKSYFQEIGMKKTKLMEVTGFLDTEPLNTNNVASNTSFKELTITSLKDYEIMTVKKDDNISEILSAILDSPKNIIVLLHTAHAKNLNSLQKYFSKTTLSSSFSQIFIFTNNLNPSSIKLNIQNELTEQKLKNVIGILPGKSKKDEYVVFAGHYDHLGIGKPNENNDSIYNGANDDASGTTAVIMLAKYFSELKDNERTLVFVAFTAEETGGYGSRYFSKQMNPDKVVALFNIEMIGTESKWKKNSAYITGYEKSDFGKILQSNLQNSKFHFEPDPYPLQNLFYRSDNATLAKEGVPAHTISTSKMEEAPNDEPNYHKMSDEISTLDMNNMSEIIKAIALSSKTIISGVDTPKRIEKEN